MIQTKAPFIKIGDLIIRVDALEYIKDKVILEYNNKEVMYLGTASGEFVIEDEEEKKQLKFLLEVFEASLAIMNLKDVYAKKAEIEKALEEIKRFTNPQIQMSSEVQNMDQEEKMRILKEKIDAIRKKNENV